MSELVIIESVFMRIYCKVAFCRIVSLRAAYSCKMVKKVIELVTYELKEVSLLSLHHLSTP
jgi:hypothetical protein